MKTILDFDTLTDRERSIFATGNGMATEALMMAHEHDDMHGASVYARHLIDEMRGSSDRENWIFLAGFIGNLLEIIISQP